MTINRADYYSKTILRQNKRTRNEKSIFDSSKYQTFDSKQKHQFKIIQEQVKSSPSDEYSFIDVLREPRIVTLAMETCC